MNNTSDITIKTEIAEIKAQLSETINRVSRTEATIEQLNRSIASGNLMNSLAIPRFHAGYGRNAARLDVLCDKGSGKAL